MYATTGTTTRRQIACLIVAAESQLSLMLADVQMQAGGSDCGVFAQAFATSLCCGHSPSTFHFDQSQMRGHLVKCLEYQEFCMFPVKRYRRQRRRLKAEENIPLFCVCRLPLIKEVPMIQCNSSLCKQWFHGKHCTRTETETHLTALHSSSCSTNLIHITLLN